MNRYIFIGVVFILCMTSCRRDVIAHAKWKQLHREWITGDTKTMTIHAPDSTQAYLLDIRIDHSKNYTYQNLYIKLLTTFPSGKKISSVTSLELIDPDGSWSGKCARSTCSVTLPLQPGFTFPEIGKYELTIEPYMRLDTIEGIKRIS
ncbi:MAG: gliding motility lipoprotein GldH, partial [Saprospiraceae bacterium]